MHSFRFNALLDRAAGHWQQSDLYAQGPVYGDSMNTFAREKGPCSLGMIDFYL